MHMADALISPVVGGIMLAATVGLAAVAVKKNQDELDTRKIPLMGVMGAFIFAAQMINFSIPATGSSGHLGGGLLLAILLGPYAGFLTMAAILLIQALFFGDGGLLAYGCNVINMGFFPCFVAYPLVYRWLTRKGSSTGRILGGSLLAAVLGLQLGAFSVVLETSLSGRTELPFTTFVLLMQPIHLAIGIVEGLVTAAVVTFVWKARPEIIEKPMPGKSSRSWSMKKTLAVLAVITILVGGSLSWFASAYPDGLEWSMERAAGTAELESSGSVHALFAWIQEKTAFLPDYDFKGAADQPSEDGAARVNPGTSTAGLVGGGLTLVLACLIGLLVRWLKRRSRKCQN